MPKSKFHHSEGHTEKAVVYFGTSGYATLEAIEILAQENIHLNVMQIMAFPFSEEVAAFFNDHEEIFVVEQNRDGQFRSLLINELELSPKQLTPVLSFDGMPITANHIIKQIKSHLPEEVTSNI